MIEAVWRRAREASRIDTLVIATDDDRIADEGRRIGAQVAMTSSEHPSGTDRAAEVLQQQANEHSVVLVVQGDEPLITPSSLDQLIEALGKEGAGMATLAEPLHIDDELFDPNVVKLVTNDRGEALYFSRSPIPYFRGSASRLESDFRSQLGREDRTIYRKHQGIYAYTAETLQRLTALPVAPLERHEGLEQLRALAAGIRIQVVDSDFQSFSVDTPDDLKRVAAMRTEAS